MLPANDLPTANRFCARPFIFLCLKRFERLNTSPPLSLPARVPFRPVPSGDELVSRDFGFDQLSAIQSIWIA
ncbi:hypothetical protein Q669_28460 [Labrenzia sp. C1B10]|nr:hypothetical protein Q669_28460 [Labrenzia sp. C1B10]ERS06427.1 hypothetical protein Q675_26930 [Labrenzia sp. C1B70]